MAPSDIDLALRLGMNFPRGPFESLRYHGIGRVMAMLNDLESTAPAHLQGRYVPAPNLEACA